MSLNLRIILSALLVLLVFITLTAAALERAFIASSETALRDRLTSQVYALMAAAEVTDSGILMPSNELDALLGLPSSGVYAQISDQAGDILWQSSSVLGTQLPAALVLGSGEKRFTKSGAGDSDFYLYAYGVNWATDSATKALTFNIATDLQSFNKQIRAFRTRLWSWLLAMAALLLVSQTIILRWGLSPLRRVGAELNRIESGEQQQIEKNYPMEIEQLTRNINILLMQERDQKTRYRNALGDLAHSLKTPLAVLQAGVSNPDAVDIKQQDSLQTQISRMNSIVEYQLQRAATAGSAGIGKLVDVKQVIERLLESFKKVYRDKAIDFNIIVDHGLMFKGDEGDLMELLGNLIDNACKWSRSHIEVVARQQGEKICLRIADDGPGILAEQVDDLLQRGVRADQTTAGNGIGLSIVKNIVEAYKGELLINNSSAGGCEVKAIL